MIVSFFLVVFLSCEQHMGLLYDYENCQLVGIAMHICMAWWCWPIFSVQAYGIDYIAPQWMWFDCQGIAK